MSKLIIALFLVISSLTIAAPDATARVWKNRKAGVSMWLPSSWKVQKQGDVHTVSNDEIGIVVRTVPLAQVEEIITHVDKNLASIVTDSQLDGAPSAHTIHGMNAVSIDAKGKSKTNGKDVLVSLMVVKTPKQKGFVVLVLIEPSQLAKHKATLGKMFKSIKPLR